MNRYEVLGIIKEVNSIMDESINYKEGSIQYGELMDIVYNYLEMITHDNPCWKYYRQFELHFSQRKNHYWVKFND